MPVRVLMTGFTPFGKVQINPSQLIIECLADRHAGLVTVVLPTEYHAAGAKIRQAISVWKPEAVIALGVAQSRMTIGLERVALNLDDAPIPDNGGVQAAGELIDLDGPIAYWSTLPIKGMLAALEARGIPSAISNHAGTYVCNHVFYTARHMIEQTGLNIPCGFIHVPGLQKTEGELTTGMPLEQMIEAIEICLDVLSRMVSTGAEA